MKVNYLNNRDIMKEIHLSKNTYCSYTNLEKDHQYDIIVMNINEINHSNIILAKQNRIAKVLRENNEKLSINDIPTSDLVFRVMTWEHIPMLPPKISPSEKLLSKINPKKSIDAFFDSIMDDPCDDEDDDCNENDGIANDITLIPVNNLKADHIKINFPPFFHYRLIDSNLSLIGKSHWIGSFDDGYFSKEHGYLTDNLARMILKLTEKCASGAKFRNYSYRNEMEGQAIMQLSQSILQFNEFRGSNPFAYMSQISINSFWRIRAIEKKSQQLRDKLLEINGMNPSYTKTNADAEGYE